MRSQHKEGEPEHVIISECKTRWSSRHDLLTQYLRVVATVNKLFRTQFQLSGNLLNKRETNAVVELINVLASVHFAAMIICKDDTDLIVADTAIQFLKHMLSGKGEVADELLELLEESYLKTSSGNLISGLLSRRPTVGSQLEF